MAEDSGPPNRILAPREYQLELFESAKKQNIIVCLGTGTGKTFISIKLIEHLAQENGILKPFSQGGKRTFFLVNSVPLVFQQAEAIKSHTALHVKAYCGEMGVDYWTRDQWLQEFEEHHVLVMTHQIYLDLIQHAQHGFNLSQANLLVFDECHHANKNHPFKKIMDCFGDVRNGQALPKVLGLTASVVGKKVKSHQIGNEIRNLERTMRSVCKTASDSNIVEKYGAKPREVMKTFSSSNHLDAVAAYLENEFCSVLKPLKSFLDDVKLLRDRSGSEEIIKRELDVAKRAVLECCSALDDIGIWAAYEVSLMLVSDLEKRIKKVSSGLSSCTKTASLLLQTTVTSLRELAWKYNEFNIANRTGRERVQQEYLKPKVKELLKLFTRTGVEQKICSIVFVQRRYAACVLSKLINNLASTTSEYQHLNSNYVTGHGSELWGVSETEMNFKKQQEILQDFRSEKFNVLVGTSVVEEGVDIPKCNLVVMFDFPQNYRAFVQSRGRGRAKDATYVMLVERSEFGERKQDQQNYQSVDEHLRNYCQTDREGPTEEEINEAINVYALPNYYTDKNAKLDMGNCINRLFRYCSKLPCDRFTSLKPMFSTCVLNDDEYQCTLKMPRNSHITGIIKGEAMASKKEALQAAALEACIRLHRCHALDDHLLPVKSSSSDSETETDQVDGSASKHKTGTKKRQRLHSRKESSQIYGRLSTDGTKKMYLHVINMTFDEVHKQDKKYLWDRKNVCLGIITNQKLPSELPPCFFCNDIGKLQVTLECCESIGPALSEEQRKLVDWFHNFIFTETLQFRAGALSKNGCRVVLLHEGRQSVNFEQMQQLQMNSSKRDGKFSSDINLSDSVVIEGYLRSAAHQSPGHYMVISSHGTQLRAVHHTRNLDCRRSRDYTGAAGKSRILVRDPKCLEFYKSPQSLTFRALFLPAILYRVDSLVSIIQLQNTISTRMADCAACDVREIPRKRLRTSSSQTPRTPSTLEQYFGAFDISKKIPPFQLLEAVTCASSAEDFNLERLEMLGDSFLKMAVSIHVYWHKDHKDEGKLTKYRIRQISNKNLFNLAMKKDLPKYIKYSTFSKETWRPPGFTTPHRPTSHDVTFDAEVNRDDVISQKIPDKSVADSMEALIGAHFMHCGYIGALRFMNWLGVDVFYDEHTNDGGELTNGNRRKSPTPRCPSKYANYPVATLDVPVGEESARYEEILEKQTKIMASFEKMIGYSFKNKVLLLEAFTHPTYSDNTITGSYQRLEFLGDAILDFLVTQHIYNNCKKDLKPGELTDLRSALVNNNIFAVIAVQNNYHQYLKEHSPHLFSNIGHFVKGVNLYLKHLDSKVIPDPYAIPVQSDCGDAECIEAPKPLGDVFESVAGAIFLDSGLDIFEVWRVCYPMLEKFIDEYSANVPKSPVRSIKEKDEIAEFGHAKILEDDRVSCVLIFKGQQFTGIGRNKRNARLSAAYKALKSTEEDHVEN